MFCVASCFVSSLTQGLLKCFIIKKKVSFISFEAFLFFIEVDILTSKMQNGLTSRQYLTSINVTTRPL